MKKVIVGCIVVLVFCVGYVNAGFAVQFTKVEGSNSKDSTPNCRGETTYHKRVCRGWSQLFELQKPVSWDYEQENREPYHRRWYGELVMEEKMVRMVLEGVNFDFDKYDLRPDAIPILEGNVAKLKAMPISRINVIGYTDSKGTEEYNQVLSERRAQAVKDYYVQQGIDSDRITVEGRGESDPVAPNVTPSGEDDPVGRAKNRRAVELQIWTQ
jgi:outer membrane protein OmpA-like peptidoglycan-associated protein